MLPQPFTGEKDLTVKERERGGGGGKRNDLSRQSPCLREKGTRSFRPSAATKRKGKGDSPWQEKGRSTVPPTGGASGGREYS